LLIGKLREAKGSKTAASFFKIPKKQEENKVEVFRAYDEDSRSINQTRVVSETFSDRSEIPSREVPQILSDQGSLLHSNSIFRSGEPNVVQKQPSIYGLGHIRREKDYKPHDYAALEESPEAKDRIRGLKPKERVNFAVEPEPEKNYETIN
jgi:hypothetical protein